MIKHLLCIIVLLCTCLIGTAQSQSKFELPAVLKIGISADSYPYMFLDSKGQASGLVVDYWRELAKQQQVKVEFVAADWADTLKLLDNGDIDLHGGLGYTEDRAQHYLLGKSYLDIFSNVFVHRDLSGVHNLADLWKWYETKGRSFVRILRLPPSASIAGVQRVSRRAVQQCIVTLLGSVGLLLVGMSCAVVGLCVELWGCSSSSENCSAARRLSAIVSVSLVLRIVKFCVCVLALCALLL